MSADVNEIKQRIDYESFYRFNGLNLKGSGAERTALCPFHDDSRESLSVNVDTGLWFCFACGARGDEFTFYARLHGVDFPAAKKAVAEFAGVDLMDNHQKQSKVVPFRKARQKKDEAPVIPDAEVQALHLALMNREKAIKFLEEKKGLNLDTITRYQFCYDGERIGIPIRDEQGRVRNIRRYHPTKEPKMLPYKTGYGEVRLFPIEALRESTNDIIICEGEWDCLLARQMGLPAICHTGGARTWKNEWDELFAGKRVIICYDNDDPGREGAAKVSNALTRVAAEVRIVTLPVTGEGEDFSDWVLKYGGTLEQWDKLIEAAQPVEYEPTKEDLPRIDAGSGDLAAMTQQAWDALIADNDPPYLFQRGGLLTRIQTGDAGEPYLAVVTEAAMRGILARVAWWYRSTDGFPKDALPPVPVVKDMMSCPELPVPIIARVVEAPVFGRNGELELEPGYHPASRTYFWSNGVEVPEVPTRPTKADITRAKELILDELLGEFPFTSETERCHAVAAMLGPFVREMIDGATPLHLIEAPSPGTGKSLLADAIAIPSTGRPAATMTEGRDEDEWRKRITASLIAAPTYLLIDNVRRKLDSAALSAALTSQAWQDRVLGRSELTKLPVKCIWLATANNPALTTEMARRTVRIRLDARVARPWQRGGFRHPDLRSWAKANRSHLIWAALVMVQNWVAQGMPAGDYVLGQYERWAHVIGGILDCLGVNGFLGNLDEVYSAADEETAQWEEFLAAWWHEHQNVPQSIRELFRIADERDLLLMIRGDKSEHSQKIRLGKALGQMRDRQIGPYRVEQVGNDGRSRSALYQLHFLGENSGQNNVHQVQFLQEAATTSEVDEDEPY